MADADRESPRRPSSRGLGRGRSAYAAENDTAVRLRAHRGIGQSTSPTLLSGGPVNRQLPAFHPAAVSVSTFARPAAGPKTSSVGSGYASVVLAPVAATAPVDASTGPGYDIEGREIPTPRPRHRYPVPLLPNFNGEGNVDDFIARFRNHATHCEWTEEERSFHLRNSLQGVAGQIVWRLSDQTKSDEILSRLRTRFGQLHQEQRFRAELKARRRRPGESIQSLANDLYHLAERGYTKERDDDAWGDIMKDIFITALNDPKLRMEVMMRQPKTMEEAADVATQIEAFQTVAQFDVVDNASHGRSSSQRPRSDPQVRTVQPSTSSSQPPPDVNVTNILLRMEKSLAGLDGRIRSEVDRALKAREVTESTSDARPTTADISTSQSRPHSDQSRSGPGRRGGGRSSGRQPLRPKDNSCFNCGSTDGHWARDCPHPKKGDGPARSSINQTQEVRRPSAVYAKAVMYKRSVQVLFDSGCDRSVVHSRLLPADIQLQPTTEKLYTADKTELPLLGTAVIKFTLNGTRFIADVAVSPAIEGLFLGVDWMKQNKAVMNFVDETIVLDGNSIRLHARPDAVGTR